MRGDIVLVPFPSSVDPSAAKTRPALVVASWEFGGSYDYLLAIVTTQMEYDPYILSLEDDDLASGRMKKKSYVRPSYLWATSEDVILRAVARLTDDKMDEVLSVIAEIVA